MLAHGDWQTAWSRAWVVNYWDHHHASNQAFERMQDMFHQATFPNSMDTHLPGLLQIDGDVGPAIGMLNALAQSNWTAAATVIVLLP